MFGNLKERSLDDRRNVSNGLLVRYPDRIPVIVDRPTASRFGRRESIPPIDKQKYLVPADLTMAKFMQEIRRHIAINSQQSLFLFVNGFLLPNSDPIGAVYRRHRDPDGFLYVTYTTENTFG